MHLSPPSKSENHPFLQLLILGISAVVGVFIFIIIGLIICLAIYGVDIINDLEWLKGANPKYIGALKVIVVAQQIGLFLAPAIMLAVFEGKKPQRFYGFKVPQNGLLLTVILLMLASTPIMSLINEWNMAMHLPSFLNDVEVWMRKLEDEGMVTTKVILSGTSFTLLFVNLLVIAVTPAICEELIFRGGLQRTLLRWAKNPHVGIWLTAIVFSTIHFQFFGFFPRLILGALFGYIYYWTGSLWYPIIGHFINNAYAVIVTWYMQRNQIPLEKAEEMNLAWYGYLISAIITIALLKVLKDKSSAKKAIDENQNDYLSTSHY
jgi:membrane protease YdiL (CAAX protease family)